VTDRRPVGRGSGSDYFLGRSRKNSTLEKNGTTPDPDPERLVSVAGSCQEIVPKNPEAKDASGKTAESFLCPWSSASESSYQ
jgi:hypothetical protein